MEQWMLDTLKDNPLTDEDVSCIVEVLKETSEQFDL